jgi:hypothetical protein
VRYGSIRTKYSCKHSVHHSLNTCQTLLLVSYITFSRLADCTVLTSYIEYAYMYEVKLVYDPEPYTLTLKESITYCATVELFLRGIHTCQSSATRILFESERDRLLGILILSESTSFTPVCVEKDSSFS